MKIISSNIEQKFEERVSELEKEGYRIIPESFKVLQSPQGSMWYFILMEVS